MRWCKADVRMRVRVRMGKEIKKGRGGRGRWVRDKQWNNPNERLTVSQTSRAGHQLWNSKQIKLIVCSNCCSK